MKEPFYLSSQDWGKPWTPRKCEYLATYKAIPTGQSLFYVKVSPVLPKELVGFDKDVEKILLGAINSDWKLEDVGRFGFIVDIYVQKLPPSKREVSVRDLIRIGVGKLHKTRKDAGMA